MMVVLWYGYFVRPPRHRRRCSKCFISFEQVKCFLNKPFIFEFFYYLSLEIWWRSIAKRQSICLRGLGRLCCIPDWLSYSIILERHMSWLCRCKESRKKQGQGWRASSPQESHFQMFHQGLAAIFRLFFFAFIPCDNMIIIFFSREKLKEMAIWSMYCTFSKCIQRTNKVVLKGLRWCHRPNMKILILSPLLLKFKGIWCGAIFLFIGKRNLCHRKYADPPSKYCVVQSSYNYSPWECINGFRDAHHDFWGS